MPRITITAEAPSDAFGDGNKLTEEGYGTFVDALMELGCEEIEIREG